MPKPNPIEYCRVCTKRQFDNAIGIICGITSKKPNFISSCPSYKEDEAYIKKNKERLEYNPKKWNRRDKTPPEVKQAEEYLEAEQSKLHIDFFEIDPKNRDVVIVKNRYDYLSMMGLLAYVYTPYHLITDRSGFIENMQEPLNMIFWLAMLMYPIVRYFMPFASYKLDKIGIELNRNEKLSWDDIASISCHEEKDDEDNYTFKQDYYIKLTNKQVQKLSLRNYTISNYRYIKQAAKRKGIKLSDREMIESAMLSFHKRYRKTVLTDCY